MTHKSLIWIAALVFPVLTIGAPKSYTVTLATPMKAGSVQLASGEYKVKVEGSTAIFTDVQSHKSQSVPATVENAGKKYTTTALETDKAGDTAQIKSIELGGSTMKLEFSN